MKNLKRVLSLGLASVMLLGMMVMGASAASFSDANDIENTEAVNLMVALNIINGKDDGSFDPNGSVTRGEMAKMITMILFGGEDPVLATNATPKFTDVTTHWARKYIEYCASQGIIAGLGNGTFAPDSNVTGTAAAKMALTALGYNATVYGFENNVDWALNINSVANRSENNLYNGLKGLNPDDNITRDQAAQILYNALKAQTVKPQYTITSAGIVETSYTLTNVTLLADRYNVTTEYGYLTGVSAYDEDEGEFTFTLEKGDIDSDDFYGSTVTFTEDVSDLFMQKVSIVSNAEGEVLGISAEKSRVLTSGAVGDLTIKSTSVKLNGVTYKYDSGDSSAVNAYEFLNSTATGNLADDVKTAGNYAYTVDLIDQDGDGAVDCVVVHPFSVYEVTYVGASTFTAGGTYKFDETVVYSGIAKGDYAVVTAAKYSATNQVIVEKAEVMTGTVSQLRSADNQVRIGSTWYTAIDATAFGKINTVNTEYDLVIVNGYIFSGSAISEASASIANAVYVTGAASSDTDQITNEKTQRVQLLFTDGTKKIVTVVEVNGLSDTDWKTDVAVGELYTYKTDSDGNYKLTSINNDDFSNIKDGTTAIKVTDGKATGGANGKSGTGTFYFNDDAVVFVTANSGKTVKVLTGAEVNLWSKSGGYATTTSDGSILYANKVSGFNYVELGVLTLTETKIPNASGSTGYGYITAKSSYLEDSDGTPFIEITMWNGNEEVTVWAESLTSTPTDPTKSDEDTYVAGTIIRYEDLGGNIGSVEILNKASAADAVIAYLNGNIEFESVATNVTEVNDDAVIFYIDTENHEGYTGGSITGATQDTADAYVKNVYVFVDGDDNTKIELLVVDTTNNLSANGDVTVPTAAGTYLSNVDDTKHTASYAKGGATIAQVTTEASAWTNAGGAKVVKASTNTDDTNVEDGDVLYVTGTDGTSHYFTLTEAE